MARPTKTSLVFILFCSLVAIITNMPSSAYGLEPYSWATRLGAAAPVKEKVTKLQFYFHDTLSGSDPTAVKIAGAADTNKSPTKFGATFMVDDKLTETADPKSKLIGRAQGLYGSACKEEIGLIMALSFCFEDGPYKDSTISVSGKNPAMNPVREIPIVGGTGVFRMARGYAIAKTHWFNPVTGDAIVGYNVTVYHQN